MTTMRLRGFARATTTSVLLLASFTAGAIPQPAAAAPHVPVLPLIDALDDLRRTDHPTRLEQPLAERVVVERLEPAPAGVRDDQHDTEQGEHARGEPKTHRVGGTRQWGGGIPITPRRWLSMVKAGRPNPRTARG